LETKDIISLIGAPICVLVVLFFVYGIKNKKRKLSEAILSLIIGIPSLAFLIIFSENRLSYPFYLPEGIGILLMVLIFTDLFRVYLPKAHLFINFGIIVFVSYFSFPWVNLETKGWLMLFLMSIMVFVYTHFSNMMKGSSSLIINWFQILIPAITAPLLLVSHALISSPLIALTLILPLAAARFYFFKSKETNFSFSYFNIAMAMLVVNANLLFVPSSGEPILNLYFLKASIILWTLAPLCSVLINRGNQRIKTSFIAFILLQLLACALALTSYMSEVEDGSTGNNYDYGSY
jgi:hypothetical protein